MGAILAGAEEAPDASTMARPAQPEDNGRAFFFAQRFSQRLHDSLLQPGTDRLLEIAPFLTTLLLLLVYPLLRYLLRDPFPAEVFRFGFISFWIGFLIVNMVRAHKTRQTILQNLEVDWLDRLRSQGAPLSHYVIFMPLKNESNRHVLFQTFLSVERLRYPKSLIPLVPIVEAEDRITLGRLEDVVEVFEPRIRVEPFVYPTGGLPVKCKATSITTAGRHLAGRIADGNFPVPAGGVKILIIDADTILHRQDLAFREWTHREEDAQAPSRGARGVVLQSLTTYTANYWKVPMLPRLHNTGFVLYQMGKMQTRGDYLVLGPGTSLDFEAFRAVDYFEPNRHNEDMQFRYKVVMEGYRVAPLKMPTWGQAPLTTRESWGQIARWARGAVDFKFVVRYQRKFRRTRMPLVRTKTFQALRALLANAMPPLTVLVPAQLILISWISPCVRDLWPVPVFLSPDVLALKLGGKSLCVSPMAAFNLIFQTIVLTSSMLLGMVVVPHTLKPIIYQRAPRRWRPTRKFMEWFRLVFSPINLHNYFLMATAQLYTQGKLALGLPITYTPVTRK
ncbi:MAG: glycosyltransferase family 2 protein [candidate division NC10 bacterium]|nr:glycosyltransferase family 2 protein [candidate division NC10 bacterium]